MDSLERTTTKLTVLTFNVGGWSLKTYGLTNILRAVGLMQIVKPVPFVEERLAALPDHLLQLPKEPDIILLQEVCEERHRQLLEERLEGRYANALPAHTHEGEHGLMVFTKKPFRTTEFLRFNESPWHEDWFFTKGMILGSLELGGIGKVVVANAHLVGGGLLHPHSRAIEAIRMAQIEQMLLAVEGRSSGVSVIGCDLNAGPEASANNYRRILKENYSDCFRKVPNGPHITWDPKNPLNVDGPLKTCPAQRCDHLFSYTHGGHFLGAHAQVVLNEPTVDVGHGMRVPLSDHFAVLATFEWERRTEC